MSDYPNFSALLDKATPLIFSLQAILGILQVFDTLEITYYPMIHRVTRVMRFELGFSAIVPLALLMMLWILWIIGKKRFKIMLFPLLALVFYPVFGLEVIITIISLLAAVFGLYIQRDFTRFLSYTLFFFGSLEFSSLLHWVVFIPLGLSSPFDRIAQVEMGLFYLGSYLVPLIVLPLLLMWVIKPLIYGGGNKMHEIKNTLTGYNGKLRKRHNFILIMAMILGIVSALYPYVTFVNQKGLGVGVDFLTYVEHAKIVESEPIKAFYLMEGSRPLFFLLIYGFSLLGFTVSAILKFLPVFLNPLLAFSSYFLANEAFNDRWAAAWAAFFTVCGYQVTVGMYSYFLTNIFGLILIFFSLGLLFRSIRNFSRIDLIVASLLGGLLVFTHPWTFLQYTTAIFLSTCLVWYDTYRKQVGNKGYKNEGGKYLIAYLVSLGLAEFIKVSIIPGGGGISATLTIARRATSLTEFWLNSIFSFRLLFGGLMANLLLLCLAVVGVFVIRKNSLPAVFFTVFPAVTSIAYAIGDETIKARLLYNVPVGVYAALGFLWIIQEKVGHENYRNLLAFVGFSMIVYLFRSLANIV